MFRLQTVNACLWIWRTSLVEWKKVSFHSLDMLMHIVQSMVHTRCLSFCVNFFFNLQQSSTSPVVAILTILYEWTWACVCMLCLWRILLSAVKSILYIDSESFFFWTWQSKRHSPLNGECSRLIPRAAALSLSLLLGAWNFKFSIDSKQSMQFSLLFFHILLLSQRFLPFSSSQHPHPASCTHSKIHRLQIGQGETAMTYFVSKTCTRAARALLSVSWKAIQSTQKLSGNKSDERKEII